MGEASGRKQPHGFYLKAYSKIPLMGAGASIQEIDGEFKQMVDYAIQYISLSTLDYRNVWWRLFHAPNSSSDWTNALKLAELLFSSPASNGKVERVFSVVNSIKVQKRSLLCNDSLDDLVLLNSDKLPLRDFSPDPGIDLWWSATTRRPSQEARRQYRKCKSRSSTVDDTESESDSQDDSQCPLELWDDLISDQ